jgi:hypothetical protein
MGIIRTKQNAFHACVRSGKRMQNIGTNRAASRALGGAPFSGFSGRLSGSARFAKGSEQSA